MANASQSESVTWHEGREIGVEGKGWTDTERYYDRLPARAHGVVREPVWELSRHSAGMCLRFGTDSPAISVRWTLYATYAPMSHFAPTGSAR